MRKIRALRRFLAAFMAAVLLMSASAPAALASFKAYINTTTRVYALPSTSAFSVAAPRGLAVTVTAAANNWARVQYKGYTAYIPVPYLNLANRITAYTAKSTPVYKLPSTSSGLLGTVSMGTAVYVAGVAGGFYRVQNSSGSITGYVAPGYLASRAQVAAAYSAYQKAQAATAYAAYVQASAAKAAAAKAAAANVTPSTLLLALLKSLLGRPYATSASAPSSFNCSSLVKYVMGKFGIPMKDTAALQALDSRYKMVTSASSLRLGDILCFDENGDRICDHTAIYVGNGYFVEASRKAGKVQVNSMSSWYVNHFMWARRPV